MGKNNGFRIASLYAAVILGAGFASGQELLQYFVNHGTLGLWGMMAAGIAFSLTGWAVLDICRRENLTDYSGFMRWLLGKPLALAAEIAAIAFLGVLFATMLAAAGATAKQAFQIPFSAGVACAAGLCLLVLLFGLEGVVRINAVLAPLMVLGGVFIGLYTFFNHTAATFLNNRFVPGWVVAALVYASYNLVTGIPVLTAAAKLANTPKDCFKGGVLGGAALTLLGVCMALPLYLHHAQIISVEIPFLVIVTHYGNVLTGLYLLIMFCALFTTAVSNAFALLHWLNRFKIKQAFLSVALVLSGAAAAHIGFSRFVGWAYPFFGLLGFFEILIILLSWRSRRT